MWAQVYKRVTIRYTFIRRQEKMSKDQNNEDPMSDRVVGKHVYGNLYEVDVSIAESEEKLREIVIEASKLANMTLYEVKSWGFGGKKGGISVIALVLESHIAVHTWIEYRYATVDVYTC
jgi:S-adenosylmethionine decarboxylase